MPPQAKVASVEAIEAFRASLITYQAKARSVVEDVSSEVMRSRLWLQNDQRMHWEGQLRRRTKAFEEARSALYSAQLSSLREPSSAERMAVTRAKHAMEEAEAKLATVKKWNRDFDSRVEPVAKRLERMHTFLATLLPQAIAQLDRAVKTLESYQEIAAPPAGPESKPPPADAAGTAESPPAIDPDAS